MILHGILALFLLLQSAGSAIHGTVTDSATGQAVVGAQVTISRLPARGPLGSSQSEPVVRIPPQTTDSAGRFAFPNLQLGNYLVRVLAEGYGDGSFVEKTSQSNGMPVTITDKEPTRDASFRLIRGSVVSGRVLGVNGEPLGNMEVSLFQSPEEPRGRMVYSQVKYTATNDRGEYRLFPVNPGRYYLSAGAPTHRIGNVPTSSLLNNPKTKHPRIFYPGVPDPSAAATIDVFAGGELAGLDFRMSEQPTFRIRGRVIDTLTGQLPRNLTVSITPRDSNLNVGGFATSAVLDWRDGTFEMQHVAPGAYIIRAYGPIMQRGNAGSPGSAEIAAAAVDVLNRDVDSVVVAFGPPLTLTGRVRMENGAPPPDGIRVNVFLYPTIPIMPGSSRPLQWNSDGTFRIEGVEPGEYFATISPTRGNGAATGVTVREARSGPTDLLTQPLLLVDPRTDEIVITLGLSGR